MNSSPLDQKDLAEAERIFAAVQEEIRVLQTLNSRLERRIRKAKFLSRGKLNLREEHSHEQLIMRHTSSSHGETN